MPRSLRTQSLRILRFNKLALLLVVTSWPYAVRCQEPDSIKNSIGMRLVEVPAGSFIMGSPRSEKDRNAREERHEVTIHKSFYMGAFEVTQAEYMKVMVNVDKVTNRSAFKGDDNPVEGVEWRLAKVF